MADLTALKSLSLRMNVETLQFFLTYPGEAGSKELNGTHTASSSHFSDYSLDDLIQPEDVPLDEMKQGRKSRINQKGLQ